MNDALTKDDQNTARIFSIVLTIDIHSHSEFWYTAKFDIASVFAHESEENDFRKVWNETSKIVEQT